jgi:DeoR/GlpR family transcriptional regulator of sugar metabolism
MSTFDRRSAILAYLRQQGRASTRELSARFGVSQVTVRTDLEQLEQTGWLARRHGGAELFQAPQPEQPFALRTALHTAEKQEIAAAAVTVIQPGDHIVLDGSTSAYHLAQQIVHHRDLTVITNNFQVAALLAGNRELDVLMIGGLLRGETWSTVGVLAEDMVGRLHAHRGFFGAAGLSAERGLTDADVREVQIKRALVRAVDEVNVLLDSSKFGQHALLTFAGLEQIQHLFTDRGVTAADAALCAEHGIRVTIA